MLIVVVVLAIVAAMLYSLSDFMEQRAAQRATGHGQGLRAGIGRGQASFIARVLAPFPEAGAALRRMIGDHQWRMGWVVGTAAYLVQGVALHFGSVAVVQSLQVTTLLFAIPLSTVGRPLRPGPKEWLGGASVCLGLGGFLAVRGQPAMSASDAHRDRVLFLLLLLMATVVALVVVASLHPGASRAIALACAAGVSFASSATLVKLTSDDLTNRGIAATAQDWPGYALALATGTGLVLQQVAFASGRLPTAVTAMVVTNPVVGTVVAVIGFGEGLPASPGKLAVVALGAVFVIVGVALLTHSPLLRQDESPDEPRGDPPARR